MGGGANPTFASSIHFNAMMPSQEIFCPSLQCAVYDSLLFGLNQPLIGNMFIPLGLIHRVQKALRRRERDFEDYLWQLLNKPKSEPQALQESADNNAIKIEVIVYSLNIIRMKKKTKKDWKKHMMWKKWQILYSIMNMRLNL